MFGISFGPKNVTVTDAHTKLGSEGHVLLDVRTHEEVREVRVPGSLHIPLDRLESESAKLETYTSIHVMCRSGGRSLMAANLLHSLGMTHAENVAGGITQWQALNLPTT
ncbi:MAG: rhodanese-like domain-containing protein [Candidatus Pacebacteria bacterium]|nr:rhodanese-like domain-containing protein [Candidatus Paceibacterota bacterium]